MVVRKYQLIQKQCVSVCVSQKSKTSFFKTNVKKKSSVFVSVEKKKDEKGKWQLKKW